MGPRVTRSVFPVRRSVKRARDVLDDFLGLEHPAFALFAAGGDPLGGAHENHAAAFEQCHIGLDRGMRIHRGIHGGRDEHGAAECQKFGRKQIVGQTLSELADHVGGRGRDEDEIRPARGIDVVSALRAVVPEAGKYRLARKVFEREGSDEASRRFGQYAADFGAARFEEADDVAGLERGDASGDAKQDALARERGAEVIDELRMHGGMRFLSR